MNLISKSFALVAALAGSAAAQELILIDPIMPIEEPGTITTDPYQYSTTWTDASGSTIEHTTISNPDGSVVESHFIDGVLAGTLYTDLEGGWTYTDGSGQLVYADYWNEKAGDYTVAYGDWATWMEFDEAVLTPIGFWDGGAILLDGTVLYALSAETSTVDGASTEVFTVSGMTEGILTALSKVAPTAVHAKARLLALLAFEPKAPKALPVQANEHARAKR